MKSIFFIAGIFFTGLAFGQDAGFNQFQQDFQKKFQDKNKVVLKYQPLPPPVGSNLSMFQLTLPDNYLSSNGIKVRVLQQDFMPCIIPDMTQFNMPVFKPEKGNSELGIIPNPGVTQQ